MRPGTLAYRLAAVLLAFATSACSTLDYYSQSIFGHLDIMQRRQPIEDLLDSDTTPPEIKARLLAAQAIRRFASTVLGLPDNGSFTRYADLERPYAVWNVVAAPSLSIHLKKWCYPFAGCVTYRGYFSEDEARSQALQLHNLGLDTYYGGVAAYSTLGWFDDPLLSTVTDYSDTQLAGLIFHELAHQQLYIPGDTLFNEGFATVVENAGVRRWLEHQADPGSIHRHVTHRRQQAAFHALVSQTRTLLEEVYASALPDSDKLRLKQQHLDALRAEYFRQRKSGDMDSHYDAWFSRELNNAKIGAVNAYRAYVPLFERLLANSGGDFALFYQRAAALGAVPGPQRLARLRQEAQ